MSNVINGCNVSETSTGTLVSCFLPDNPANKVSCAAPPVKIIFGLVGPGAPQGIAMVDLSASNYGASPVDAVPWGILNPVTPFPNHYEFCSDAPTKVFELVTFKAGVSGVLSNPSNAQLYDIIAVLGLTVAKGQAHIQVYSGNISVAAYQNGPTWNSSSFACPCEFLITLNAKPATPPPAAVTYTKGPSVEVSGMPLISARYTLTPFGGFPPKWSSTALASPYLNV
jgi:hypothetical protein